MLKNIIIAIANQKGGVGKTTTAINLSYNLALLEKKVLIIDFDPQSSCTLGLGKKDTKFNIYEALNGKNINDLICETSHPNLFLIGSNTNLAGAEIELVNLPKREFYLKNIINQLQFNFDFIIIDTSPSLGLLTLNALVASNYIISPVQSEFYALEGLALFVETVSLVKKLWNKNLEILGLLLTMYDKRNLLHQEVERDIKKYFNSLVFETIITRNIRLAESVSFGQSINEYDKKSSGALAYCNLAKEILKKAGLNG